MFRLLSTYPFLKGYLLAAEPVTCLLTGSALLIIRSEDVKAVALAVVEAKTSFKKDQIFRQWVPKYGGLYVPVRPDIYIRQKQWSQKSLRPW